MYFFTHFVLSSGMEKTSFFNLYRTSRFSEGTDCQWKFIDNRLVFLYSMQYYHTNTDLKLSFTIKPFSSSSAPLSFLSSFSLLFVFCSSFHFLEWNESILNEPNRDSFRSSSYSLHPSLYVSIQLCEGCFNLTEREECDLGFPRWHG